MFYESIREQKKCMLKARHWWRISPDFPATFFLLPFGILDMIGYNYCRSGYTRFMYAIPRDFNHFALHYR